MHAYLGDALLFGGDAGAALSEYDLAIKQNPDDFRLYFFRGNAHRHEGKREAMLDDFRTSLTLNPRYQTLITALQGWPNSEVRVEPEVLVPRAFVRRDGKAIAVYADTERPEWLAWAMCKGLWLGDTAHRKEMLGTDEGGWSSVEELECLASLVSVYASRRERGEGSADERLERLVKIVKDGMTTGFVLYEIGSRIDPQIVLRLDADVRAQVRKYVEKYVLVSDAPQSKPKK